MVERARNDIEAGRLWKARDRLIVAVKERPADQAILGTLGEVYFAMGDQPAAGRYWFLTERRGSEMAEAMAAFEERWGSNLGEKLKLLSFAAGPEEYPLAARERLHSLEEEARRSGVRLRGENAVDVLQPSEESTSPGEWMGMALVLILGPGLWLLGIAAAVYLLAGWLL